MYSMMLSAVNLTGSSSGSSLLWWSFSELLDIQALLVLSLYDKQLLGKCDSEFLWDKPWFAYIGQLRCQIWFSHPNHHLGLCLSRDPLAQFHWLCHPHHLRVPMDYPLRAEYKDFVSWGQLVALRLMKRHLWAPMKAVWARRVKSVFFFKLWMKCH